MITSVRSGAFDHGDAWTFLLAPAAHCAAMHDRQKRVARLRELAREFRRILNECSVFDGGLTDTLREVIVDLEEEADKLEYGRSKGERELAPAAEAGIRRPTLL